MYSQLDQSSAQRLSNWADFIVVGCGAAGSVVAARLAENPKNKILVLELGPNNLGDSDIETPSHAGLLWNHPDGPNPSPSSLDFQTTKQLGRSYHYPRGNGMGGSSNHHSLVDGRGSGKIYDQIAHEINSMECEDLGRVIYPAESRWAYQNVLPYFKKMENYRGSQSPYHGTSGWLSVRPGTVKSPFYKDFIQAANIFTGAPYRSDMNSAPENTDGIGIGDVQVTPEGKRSSAYQDLLIPQMSRTGNIVIIFNTLVSRVLFEGTTAVGVSAIHQSKVYLADSSLADSPKHPAVECSFFVRKEVILSGGAINSPQILLLSGIGPREDLVKLRIPVLLDNPNVGRNLMDHHEIAVTYEIDPSVMIWPAQAANLLDKTQDPDLRGYFELFADSQEQKEGSGGVVLDWYSGIPTDIDHDLHIHCSEGFWFDFDLKSNEPLPDGKVRVDYYRSEHYPENFRVFNNCLIENLRPGRADGSIKLASSDPTVPPLIDLKLYSDDKACHRLALGIEIVRRIQRESGMRKYFKKDQQGEPLEIFPGPEVQGIDQLKLYTKRWSAFGHHISGTCGMGAVVNSRLQVRGFSNLRVVDTSIYPAPYLHGYNTSRGAYLIGELASDFIKEFWE